MNTAGNLPGIEVKPARRVLGIDTSLRSTGVAVVQARGAVLEAVTYDVIRNPPDRSLSKCLDHLYRAVGDIIRRAEPRAAAIEGIFFSKNVRIAVILGETRGVVIAACVAAGLPVFEYAPRRVKQAVVGFGAAGKEQVQQMVVSLLNLRAVPPEDAADALALAICHLHADGPVGLSAKEI